MTGKEGLLRNLRIGSNRLYTDDTREIAVQAEAVAVAVAVQAEAVAVAVAVAVQAEAVAVAVAVAERNTESYRLYTKDTSCSVTELKCRPLSCQCVFDKDCDSISQTTTI